MTTSYEDIDAARTSIFPSTVVLGEDETAALFTVLDRVARAAGQQLPDRPAGRRVAAAGTAFRRRLGCGHAVGGDAVLDLAAELLETADQLSAGGQHVEALALEGVVGRLTEHLVAAGPHEGTPLGGRR